MAIYESFDEQKQFACRVIADHARTTAFAIADGILPGNEGRNYVLRKIMRRAIYQGREHLGFDGLFFNKVCDFVVELMGGAYPELVAQRDFIGKMVRLEEERFGATMTVGLQRLQNLLNKNDYDLQIGPESESIPTPGFVELSELAKLYDTFGLPIDLMYVVLKGKAPTSPDHEPGERPTFWKLRRNIGTTWEPVNETFTVVETHGYVDWDDETGMSVREYSYPLIDEVQFKELIEDELKKLQEHSTIGKTRQPESTNPAYVALSRLNYTGTEFRGYEELETSNLNILAIVRGDDRVESTEAGKECTIVLDKTPFYAESGGQVGDTGVLFGSNGLAKVVDTFSPIQGLILHKCQVEKGMLTVGDTVTATVDAKKRDATRRNHTATHLVHAALKEVLGTHVKQAGSVVSPQFLRFDFTHYQAISEMEMQEIEDLVNLHILKNEPVNTNVMAIEDAMRTGAVALFGEKYGSAVRVLSVGGGEFSRELCGGTHVRATGDIGTFKIVSDEAIASGVRRIRAITGTDAFARFREDERLIDRSLQALKTQRDNLPAAIEKLQEELKKARRENDDLKMKIATGAASGGSEGDEPRDVNGVKVIAKVVEGLDKSGMRHLSDTLMAKLKSGVVILGRAEDDKVSFIVRVSDDLTDRVKAGGIVQQIAPIVSGRGGGKPDMAEGGGTDAGKLAEALEASHGVIASMLGA